MALLVWLASVKTWVEDHVIRALEIFDELRTITATGAYIIIGLATAILVTLVVQIWMKYREVGYLKIILASLSPPIFLLALFLVPAGFAGIPDENCTKYDGGKLTYSLVAFAAVPKDTEDIYGDEWIIFLVRARERWGSDTHQCRLSLSDQKVKDLMAGFARLQLTAGTGYSRGNITFSFGGRNEVPNVKIRPLDPDPKTDPPEVGRSDRRDT